MIQRDKRLTKETKFSIKKKKRLKSKEREGYWVREKNLEGGRGRTVGGGGSNGQRG